MTLIQFTFWLTYDSVFYLALIFNGYPEMGKASILKPSDYPCSVSMKVPSSSGRKVQDRVP